MDNKIISELSIQLDSYNNRPLLSFSGELTSEARDSVQKYYEEATRTSNDGSIIIDFSQTTYINSTGITLLIRMLQESAKKKGKITFVGLSDHQKQIMNITGIDQFVDIVENLDMA